jgi:hypothetical protein
VVQDSEPTDSESKLTCDNQPEWIAKICKRYSLGKGGAEELMPLYWSEDAMVHVVRISNMHMTP